MTVHEKQVMVTAFPKVPEEFFHISNDINQDLLEDQILELENTDFHVNKKKIAIKMMNHETDDPSPKIESTDDTQDAE